MWMNEWEVEDAAERFRADETPNLHRGAGVLLRLKNWTNSHSDGWAYWPKPGRAAAKLQELLYPNMRRWDAEDITDAELTKALSPIKAFLTRQGVDHDLILKEPAPLPAYRPGLTITRQQLEAWCCMSLTDEQVERLDMVLPDSSVPEAIQTIVESFEE